MPKPALRETLTQSCLQLNVVDAVHSAVYATFCRKLNGAKAKRRPLAPLTKGCMADCDACQRGLTFPDALVIPAVPALEFGETVFA
ncbi:hypothetical protein GGD66_005912 [Bradyrhizobium sp. CIR48]|nr:hypothetical protein [Bradyrhizobium sp. CIR48]